MRTGLANGRGVNIACFILGALCLVGLVSIDSSDLSSEQFVVGLSACFVLLSVSIMRVRGVEARRLFLVWVYGAFVTVVVLAAWGDPDRERFAFFGWLIAVPWLGSQRGREHREGDAQR